MSGKYYWVKTKEGKEIEIGYKRDSGLWELCGVDVNENVNDIISEVLGEVSEWTGTSNEKCNLHIVNNSLQDKLYGVLIMTAISALMWLIYILANCC